MTKIKSSKFAINVILVTTLFLLIGIFQSTAWGDSPDSTGIEDYHPKRLAVDGYVYDEKTGDPIVHVTVQVLGSGMATKTNADGRYRMMLERGEHRIKVSHVGYYSQEFEVILIDSVLEYDVRLKTSVYNLGERKVYARAYDPAQRIIAEAIRHKQDILSQIHDYSFDAYSKLVLQRADKPDSESFFMITETQSTSYWEQPDKYKEVIAARKQSANLSAEGNLVAVGQMLNFNRNRIDIDPYDVVSPTATDAMDHYNYYLLDTVYLDGKAVFVLEVEPMNEYAPLFVGEIQIADETYDVVKVDVGFSKGIHIPMIEDVRYYQSMAQIADRYWLPVEIGFSGQVSFDIPIPGIPKKLKFAHVASIYSYDIETGHPGGTFGEYDIEVDEKADDIDSTAWAARQTIPLSDLETYGYARIDSIKNAPKPIHKQVLKGLAMGALIVTFGYHDIFHFDRVEGPYVGIGLNPSDLIPNTRLRLKTGYSIDNRMWQYEYGAAYRLWRERKLWLGVALKDEIVHRPTTVSEASYNSTTNALFFKIDPFDYYREKGVSGFVMVKPVNHTLFGINYRDYYQSSEIKNTDYGFFRSDILPRDNPQINDGRMRSIAAVFSYDSRKLIKNKNRDNISYSSRYLRARAKIEYASPCFIANDFDFRRYSLRVEARTRLFGLGMTKINGFAGSSDGTLPFQKYFVIDFHDPNFFMESGFNTVMETNFGGDRAASIYLVHDFGTNMFRNSGIEYLKMLPPGLTIHGGAMWSEFKRPPMRHDSSIVTAPTAYSEIGFGLSNLTPFLMPFNLAMNFTWQLSTYNTLDFSLMFNFKL